MLKSILLLRIDTFLSSICSMLCLNEFLPIPSNIKANQKRLSDLPSKLGFLVTCLKHHSTHFPYQTPRGRVSTPSPEQGRVFPRPGAALSHTSTWPCANPSWTDWSQAQNRPGKPRVGLAAPPPALSTSLSVSPHLGRSP